MAVPLDICYSTKKNNKEKTGCRELISLHLSWHKT